VGGRTYLSGLSNEVPVASHVNKYAQIIREKYVKRQMISVGASMSQWAF